ncbi:hypothetical protein Lal_00046730 [Lupinus albus]|nr:hypothetical protein Lal_00046730 [Lupinus albus]
MAEEEDNPPMSPRTAMLFTTMEARFAAMQAQLEQMNRRHDGGSSDEDGGLRRRYRRGRREEDRNEGGGGLRGREERLEGVKVQALCPKLDRRPNVMHAGEARDHGESADKVVAVRDLCEISDQASGLVLVSAERVRTLLRKRDQYSFSKCHKRVFRNSLVFRDDKI